MFETLNQSDEELLDDCDVQTSRGSGPGGTKSDTTESAVRIRHQPSGVAVKAAEGRSQHENRRRALRRLRIKYAATIRHDVDTERAAVPEQLEQYLGDGLRVNVKNPHFPFWVKLVMDVFSANQARLGETAEVFGLSTNQLVNFLARHDTVWAEANRLREEHDHGRLKR
jgi:hypothetical protein